jgi:hypothetical protein
LQDLTITDFSVGKTYKCPEIQAKFSITEYDQFSEILESESLIKKILETQNQNLDPSKKTFYSVESKKNAKIFGTLLETSE